MYQMYKAQPQSPTSRAGQSLHSVYYFATVTLCIPHCCNYALSLFQTAKEVTLLLSTNWLVLYASWLVTAKNSGSAESQDFIPPRPLIRSDFSLYVVNRNGNIRKCPAFCGSHE